MKTVSDEARRAHMVATQIANRGVRDARVLAAMRRVPRHRFVPEHLRDQAYDDTPLPIGAGQTISQPLIVATMAEALKLSGDETVLEIGTGSGYGAAVLDELAGRVVTVERIGELAEAARRALQATGHDVTVIHDDGTRAAAWADGGPFDGIVVTASGPRVPEALKQALAEGGRLVMPVGPEYGVQRLLRVTRTGDGFIEEDLGGVRFVPLIGAEGWHD